LPENSALKGWRTRKVPATSTTWPGDIAATEPAPLTSDRGHDAELAHHAPAPPQQRETDDRHDPGDNGKNDIHDSPQRPREA
jgi:hypothetical protein